MNDILALLLAKKGGGGESGGCGRVERKEVTVEFNSEDGEIILDGFPAFDVGDTVTVKVDGVEHTLVAFDDDGYPAIGDSYNDVENGTGEYGWQIYQAEMLSSNFCAIENHSVSYVAEVVHKIDPKFLPDGIANKFTAYITEDGDGNLVCDKTFEEIEAAMETQTVVLDFFGVELRQDGGVQGRNYHFAGSDFAGLPVVARLHVTIMKDGAVEVSEEGYDLSSLKMG